MLVPFRPKGVLPVLPRQISWPVLNNFHSAVDLLPAFGASFTPNKASNQWKGACFYRNEARLDFTASDNSSLGGGVLYLKVTSVISLWTRMQPAYAANMWNEALNKQLGTEELDLYGILAETELRGSTFDQLLLFRNKMIGCTVMGNQQHA